MKDKNKTKNQLIDEVAKLRKRIAKLEESKTERKKAEEALRESEERYREMVEKAGIGILIDDENGNVKYANKKAAELYGYSLEEMNDQSIKSLVHPDDFERVMKFHKARIQGKRVPSSYVFKNVKKDGTVRYFELIAAPDKKEESIIGTRSYIKDITEQKRAGEKLQEERDKAQKYLDIAGVILIAINRDGNVTLINKKGCDILGYDEREIIGMNWFDNFIPERLRDIIKPVSEKLLAGKIEPAEYFENPVLTRKGEERLIAWHNTILRDEKGTIVGHLSSGEDITERKRAEEALRNSEERFRQFFENAPDYCYMVSPQGKTLNINAAALAVLGYKKKDVIGKPLQTIIYAPSSVENAKKLFML